MITKAFRPWQAAVLITVLYVGLAVMRGGSLRELIQPAQTGGVGYDGQFTYLLAVDPALAAGRMAVLCNSRLPPGYFYVPALHQQFGRMFSCEMPAYRVQRILHAALVRVLSLGQAALVPWAMLAVSLAALGAGVAALSLLLAEKRASPWFALVYGLFPGVLVGVRVSTTEPLAYGLVLLAILAAARGWSRWQAALLALAALSKETTLIFAAGYVAHYALSGRWRAAARLALVVALPFAAWQLVLRAWFGQFGVGSGGAGATPFELLPYNGVWRIADIVGEWYRSPVLIALIVFALLVAVLPSLWALWRGGGDVLRRRWDDYAFLLLVNAAVFPFVPFSTYNEPLGLMRFLPGLVITVLLYAALRRERRVLVYSTLWLIFGLLFI